jgi:UDPglucose--hexose-1-phosphate uridylyltransferase
MPAYEGHWEKRWHPLRREWVVYAAHRNQRPWLGAETPPAKTPPSAYDPHCYLCPGNRRVSGQWNPRYDDVFIFDNDHPVVGPDAPAIAVETHQGLYRRAPARGLARVLCYDPRHHVSMAEMSAEGVYKVFLAWQAQTRELAARPDIHSALIFENKGELVGVSNPHPHCQIYAVDFPFRLVEQQLEAAAAYRAERGRGLFVDIIAAEQADARRIIAERPQALAFVPFFARYAYEVMIFPKRRHATLLSMSEEELRDLAGVFQETIRRYDGNYGISFPYVMSVLQAPVDGGEYDDFHLHLLLQPPLRQPNLAKFLAGPEIGGGNFMADTMPEEKAAELRAVKL